MKKRNSKKQTSTKVASAAIATSVLIGTGIGIAIGSTPILGISAAGSVAAATLQIVQRMKTEKEINQDSVDEQIQA